MVLKTIAAPCRSCLPSPELQNLEYWSSSACPPFVDHWFAHDAQNGFTRNHISFHSRHLRRLMWFIINHVKYVQMCANMSSHSAVFNLIAQQPATESPVMPSGMLPLLLLLGIVTCHLVSEQRPWGIYRKTCMGWNGLNMSGKQPLEKYLIFSNPKLGQILKSGRKEKRHLVHTLAPKAS